jgi:hypothetical protein
MKKTNKTIQLLLAATAVWGLSACGGGGSSSSSVTDSDGDGFYDAIDPAPHDASNPGDFSSPEKILANPLMQTALLAAQSHGVAIRADLGHTPPNLTGYYRQDAGTGRVVATSTGIDAGHTIVGSESRVSTQGESYESASVFFTGGSPISFDFTKGAMLRGEGSNFTTYTPYKSTCTEGGANYATYGIEVSSATQDGAGWISQANVARITLTSTGTLTPACDVRLMGDAGVTWAVYIKASERKIIDVTDLAYMCVDGGNAYAPTESWKSDGKSCSCTTDYTVECK